MTLKLKALVALVVAGLVVGALAIKKHITDGIANGELEKKEEELKADADKKLKEEVIKLEEAKKAELDKLEAEKAIAAEKIKVSEKKTKKELSNLSKSDSEAFKEEVKKKLGVSEKKTPGRKPKAK